MVNIMIWNIVLLTLGSFFLIQITNSKQVFRERKLEQDLNRRGELLPERFVKDKELEIDKWRPISLPPRQPIKHDLKEKDLKIRLEMEESNACKRKFFACVIRVPVGLVCGFQQSTNEFKVYDSECLLYTHACSNDLDIALVDMKQCEDKNKGQTDEGDTSPPIRAFIRPENTVVPEGSDVTLLCYVVGGNPQPEISWSVTSRLKSRRVNDQKVTTSSFNIRKITKGMAGTYKCTAYNVAGSVSASTTIDVQYKPTVRVWPSYLSINQGQSAEFKCSASGKPKPRIVWKKGRVIVSSNPTLRVTNAQLSDHGAYRCEATNSMSSYSADVRLNVKVNGGWSPESTWDCTDCGSNPYNNQKCQKKCERKCNNPTPRNGGAECSGDEYVPVDCSSDKCATPNKKKDCFPGDAVVPLANGDTRFMRDLKIGDNVLAVTSEQKIVSSKVLTFLHREEKPLRVYKDIQTDENTISLSPKHLIFASEDRNFGNLQAKFASEIKTGMYIGETKSGRIILGRVRKLSNGTRTGLYAPLTEHGNIIVDHVMSSCYATINSHWLAHIGLSPLRWYYMYGGLVADDVPKEGIHWFPTLIQPLLHVLPES